ncbi:MAG: DUF308 domain-containing protein [Clostridia bacterium]|nr:DUF308 domain-containing protein [Clostridia bacterium]
MLNKLIKNKMIYALASVVIGIILIIRRGQMADDVVRIIGWLMIGMAAVYAVSYFVSSDKEQVQLGFAILAGIGGLLLVLLSHQIVNLFPILAGVLLIINGIANLSGVSGNTGDAEVPAYSKVVAIAVIALGVLMIIFSRTLINATVLVMGICLVLNGLAEMDIIRRFW